MDNLQVAYQDDQVIVPPDLPIRLNVSNAKLIELRQKGLSYSQIEKLTGIDSSTAFCRLKAIGYKDGDINAFKAHRADILTLKQINLLNALNEKTIAAMPGRDLVVATGILYDKERLERGQSSINIDLRAEFEALQGVKSRKDLAIERLRALGYQGEVACNDAHDM